MKQAVLKSLVGLLAAASSLASANCVTDTEQAQFQAGVATNLNLTSSPGNVLLATSGGGSGTLDQENTSFTANGERASNSSNTQWAGQTFTAGKSGSLAKVDVNLFCNFCSGTPSVTVSIRAVSGGLPTGSDLASATFNVTGGGTQTWYSASFASPTTVTSGTQYAIAIRPTVTMAGTLGFSDSAVNTLTGNDVYAGGALIFSTNSGASWSIETGPKPSVDGGFKTYIGGGTSGYVSAGDLVSSLKDSAPPAGATPTWSTLSFTSSVPSGTAVKFQAAASGASGGPFNFVGPDGTANSYFTTSNADLSRFNGNRYLKYRAFLTSGSSTATPTLNDATVCFSSVTASTSSDVSISVDDGSTTEVPGTTVAYTITASNAGPDAVSRATVNDTFAAPLTACSWTCSASSGGSCQASGIGNIADGAVSLPVGATATYHATCTLPTSATGSISNTATITDPAGVTDANPANNTDTDTDTLTPQVELSVTINDGATSQTAGLGATYSMLVQNGGPSDGPNTIVTDTFPSTLTCTWTCSGTSGGSCPASGSGNIGAGVNLPKGARVNFIATCSIASSATGTLSNSVSAAPANGVTDTNTANNSATDSDSLVVKPDVSLTMTDNQDTAKIGDPIDYVLVVRNNGPSDAAVNLTDTLPSQLSTKAAWLCTGTGGAVCAKGQGSSMNTNATIPVGGVATYVFSTTVVSDDAGNSFTNVAVAHVNNGSDPNGANNSSSDTDVIVVFLSGFESNAVLAAQLAASGGTGSTTAQFGVDAGLLNQLGPAPVTVATGQSSSGAKLFDLQLIRLGTDVMMRSVVPIDATGFSDVSPWEIVDLGQLTLRLQWQPASSVGDDGYISAGSATQEALLSASNAREALARVAVPVENNIPWLVLQAQ